MSCTAATRSRAAHRRTMTPTGASGGGWGAFGPARVHQVDESSHAAALPTPVPHGSKPAQGLRTSVVTVFGPFLIYS